MALNPPDYPQTLTQAHWNRKKSLIAKAAGATGVGEAARTAQRAFDQIDWKAFKFEKPAPGSAIPAAMKEVEDAEQRVSAAWDRTVEPTRQALHQLRKHAEAAERKFARNPLTKADSALAKAIASQAVFTAAALNRNGEFFDRLQDDIERAKKELGERKAALAQRSLDTQSLLHAAVDALARFASRPSSDRAKWDNRVALAGEKLCLALKANPRVAPQHLKTWQDRFGGFAWDKLGLTAAATRPGGLNAALSKLLSEVKIEAKVLLDDLA